MTLVLTKKCLVLRWRDELANCSISVNIGLICHFQIELFIFLPLLSISPFILFPGSDRKEGAVRTDEPSQIREVRRHGLTHLPERSQCVAQLEGSIHRWNDLREYMDSITFLLLPLSHTE